MTLTCESSSEVEDTERTKVLKKVTFLFGFQNRISPSSEGVMSSNFGSFRSDTNIFEIFENLTWILSDFGLSLDI